jgi:phytol kinase
MIIKGYIYTYLYLFLIIGISYVLNKSFKVRTKITRKLVHIFIAPCYLIMYHYFGTSINIIIPPISFILLNYISYKYSLIKCVEDGSHTLGTIYYPISVFIMALITYYVPSFNYAYGIGYFCMAFGDGLAPLVAGYLRSRKIYNNKTLVGSLTVLIVSIIVVLGFNIFYGLNYNFLDIIIVGLTSSTLELIGIEGLDNLYLPLGVSMMVYLLGVI